MKRKMGLLRVKHACALRRECGFTQKWCRAVVFNFFGSRHPIGLKSFGDTLTRLNMTICGTISTTRLKKRKKIWQLQHPDLFSWHLCVSRHPGWESWDNLRGQSNNKWHSKGGVKVQQSVTQTLPLFSSVFFWKQDKL